MTQISYLGYCALGAGSNSRLMRRSEYIGQWYSHETYWLMT